MMSEQTNAADSLSSVLLELINSFPGLEGKTVSFAVLDEASGIAMFPASGTAVESVTEDVVGNMRQVCLYPFKIVCRAAPRSEIQRLRIRELLDSLGRWLELQPVNACGDIFWLGGYPALSEKNAVIKHIGRSGSAHLGAARRDGTEDWEIALTVSCETEY